MDWSKVGHEHSDMSTKMFEYVSMPSRQHVLMSADILSKCINEIRVKAILYEEVGVIPILESSSCVLKSDITVTTELKEELKRAVSVFEDVPDHQKDWHPGSDGKVLDLVHPSLFPLVYTRSRILPHSTIGLSDCLDSNGTDEIIPDPLTHPDYKRD
jgi:hypothetical protein